MKTAIAVGILFLALVVTGAGPPSSFIDGGRHSHSIDQAVALDNLNPMDALIPDGSVAITTSSMDELRAGSATIISPTNVTNPQNWNGIMEDRHGVGANSDPANMWRNLDSLIPDAIGHGLKEDRHGVGMTANVDVYQANEDLNTA